MAEMENLIQTSFFKFFLYIYCSICRNWENVYRLDCETLEWEKISSPSSIKVFF